jgi:hypothetical protein
MPTITMLRFNLFINNTKTTSIQVLSAALAAKFKISTDRCQLVWPVAIVPTERKGKTDRNVCYTACGNLMAVKKNYYITMKIMLVLFFTKQIFLILILVMFIFVT